MDDSEIRIRARLRRAGESGPGTGGAVTAVSDDLLSVELEAGAGRLALGEALSLTLGGLALTREIECPARPVGHELLAGAERYRLEVAPEVARLAAAACNQRGSFRAVPREEVAVEIRGGEPEEAVPGVLGDVSAAGLSVVVEPERDAALRGRERFWLAFQLPGEPDPLEIAGRWVFRRLGEGGIHYGLVFDSSGEAPDPVCRRIEAWVQRYLVDALRRNPEIRTLRRPEDVHSDI